MCESAFCCQSILKPGLLTESRFPCLWLKASVAWGVQECAVGSWRGLHASAGMADGVMGLGRASVLVWVSPAATGVALGASLPVILKTPQTLSTHGFQYMSCLGVTFTLEQAVSQDYTKPRSLQWHLRVTWSAAHPSWYKVSAVEITTPRTRKNNHVWLHTPGSPSPSVFREYQACMGVI